MKTRILFIALILSFFTIKAQDIPIGQWRMHLPYTKAIGVQCVGDEIYCLTDHSLFVYNCKSGDLETITKLDGLYGNTFTAIGYNESENCVMIGYEDGTFDLIKDNVIITVPSIRESIISTVKRVNRIYCNDQFAYLCCGFGVVAYDVENEIVKDTYQFESDGAMLNTWDFVAIDKDFYAATDHGIYTANQDDPLINYYKSWEQIPTPDTGACYAINYWKGKMVYYMGNKHSVYTQTPGKNDYQSLSLYFLNPTESSKLNITTSKNQLLISGYPHVYVFTESYQSYKTIDTLRVNDSTIVPRPTQAIYTGNNQYFVADFFTGLIQVPDIDQMAAISIKPNGPYSYRSYNMTTDGTNIWVASGGHLNDWSPGWNNDGIYCFDGYLWTSYNRANGKLPATIHDVTNIVVDPKNKNHIFAGTWGAGLLEMSDGTVANIYNSENSPLQKRKEDPNQGEFVAGVAYDNKGLLWVANSNAANLLLTLDVSGNWESYYLGNQYSNREIRSLMIDRYNNKWIMLRGGQLIVYNETSTAKVREISAASGLEAPAFSIAEDKNGDIWIGTNDGIYIIKNAYNILTLNDGSLPAVNIDRPKLTLGGFVSYLLSGETIVSISVNGANEKWCASNRQGLYKIAADGLSEVFHLTAEEYPLLSNVMMATCIADNGEVFMATDQGIVSYRDEAAKGTETNNNVYAFPNPVKPNYDGPIAIHGVVDMASVKITDVGGNLVYSTNAQGGQAIWNARDFNGKRVKTGVYIVFITNDDGTETTITKIMVLN